MLGASSQQPSVNLKKLKKIIESEQTPYKRIPLCDYYRIDPAILIKGVRCVKCGSFGNGTIKRIYWYCNICGHADAQAMNNTIKEYFSLVSHMISNSELREFSLLESRHAASRILLKYDMEKIGEQKVRKYRVKQSNWGEITFADHKWVVADHKVSVADHKWLVADHKSLPGRFSLAKSMYLAFFIRKIIWLKMQQL